MNNLHKDVIEAMQEMWGQTFCSRALLYEAIFFKFREKGITFGWRPRTKHVFIGYENSHEAQKEFVMTSTHDDCGWAVAELAGISDRNFLWNGFSENAAP